MSTLVFFGKHANASGTCGDTVVLPDGEVNAYLIRRFEADIAADPELCELLGLQSAGLVAAEMEVA